MPHHTPLIGTIVAGLVIAFFMGAIAHRLKISPIAGYLLAGVLVGPFTPGFVADASLAAELAEIGVILLMFGVGLHFSLRDLLSVRNIAIPGALVQITAATLMGVGIGYMMGWTLAGGFVFGLALSVASTVVLLRALQSRNLVETERGRIAVGWLIVEDLVMVLALVLLPALASGMAKGGASSAALAWTIGGTMLKVAGFVALMLIVGRRVLPWALHWVVHTGSRELFRLAVLAIALGVAFGATYVFDVSFALGAFFAGMILGETQLSRRAAEETLPLRDAFAVLFFVSVGMLFDPAVVTQQPLPLLVTVLTIVVGKSVAAWLIVRAFRHPNDTALTISASLAQIGEFSFILANLGTELRLLPEEGRDLILAGAMISIFLNPVIFRLAVGKKNPAKSAADAKATPKRPALEHVIVVGYGRVGKLVTRALKSTPGAVLLIEAQPDLARDARNDGFEAITGNALEPGVLNEAGIAHASRMVIAIPEGFEAGAIVQQVKAMRADLPVIARAHSDDQLAHLVKHGADDVVQGEKEIARRMLELIGAKPAKAKAAPGPAISSAGMAASPDKPVWTLRKPPEWFKWSIWAGIALAVIVPAACVVTHGEVPGYRDLPSFTE
ncbi:potassium efflux system protein [Novosphingobium sp. Rr 2-17]|uniref:YbaL family putative K(+) efflux transporter n=1 Tax=Novosphingobium sp. Rr 2-17 TaxID=555793 RepID=UPI0002697B0B|nr:YbaL family putative K(+) efflux transporter [Novosphingobium sp. Rr 2-17]EIZ80723.1 potassium efflux system protein [Novosphingobium sp. Rr 2-17]